MTAVGATNGFASQIPWPSGATSPPGLTALSKHPYHGITRYPADQNLNPNKPLDALGHASPSPSGAPTGDDFVPTYDALFPEYALSAIQTETLARDLSPTTSTIYGVEHGRFTHPPGAPAPAVWLTELNLDLTNASPSSTSGAPPASAVLTTRDIEHIQAKAALRTYTAYVNKGVGAVYLFATKCCGLGLVPQRFYDQVDRRHGGYPGTRAGGPTMDALRRLSSVLSRARKIRTTRSLTLKQVADLDQRLQFDGQDLVAHPPLYDRDVFAFLPFQLDAHSWVVPNYVMTRGMTRIYRPALPAGDPRRFDLPDSPFRITIGGIHAASARATSMDPMTGLASPVILKPAGRRAVVVYLEATDSPRLLLLTD